jgi:putative ABC transport system permease protein
MIIPKLAARNVRKNWRHSLAATLSIAAGFVAIVMFEGYISDVKERYRDLVSGRQMLGDLLIEKKGAQEGGRRDDWAYQLGPREQQVVEQLLAQEGANVRARVRFLNVGGMLSNGESSTVFVGIGYDVVEGQQVRAPRWEWNTEAGTPLAASEPDTILVGKGLGTVLDCKMGDATGGSGTRRPRRPLTCPRTHVQLTAATELGRLNAIDPEIVGVVDAGFKEIDQRYVAMSLPAAQRLLDTEAVSLYSVKLVDPATAEAVADRIRSAAAGRGVELEVGPWEAHPLGDLFRRAMALLELFRSFIGTVAVIIAGMSVLNVLVKAVRERTREIGTLRSLGFRRSQIVLLFSTEAALLGVAAVAVGSLFTLAASWFINHHANITYKAGMLAEPIPLTVSASPVTYIATGLLLTGLAALAALLPARRAARMKIPNALAHV